MNGKLLQLAAVASLCVCTVAIAADDNTQVKEEVRDYHSVGRIKWHLPSGPDFGCGFMVPHFTQGARVGCASREGDTETKIEVYSRDLAISATLRRERFEAEVKKMLPDAREPSFTLRTRGLGSAIVYATLTDKNPKTKNPRATIGYYSKGPFHIRFFHESRDASDRELERIFAVILSAEPLDAKAILAWKLSDYKDICESRFPGRKQGNDAAFAASMFWGVDWLRLMQERHPATSPEETTLSLKKAKESLGEELAQGPFEELEWFCSNYPGMTIEAERGLHSGRRRGMVGLHVQEVTLEAARANRLPTNTGALVNKVSGDGPAARAGLRSGDVILSLSGVDIASSADVVRIIGGLPAGSRLDVSVSRGGERLMLPVVSADAPD